MTPTVDLQQSNLHTVTVGQRLQHVDWQKPHKIYVLMRVFQNNDVFINSTLSLWKLLEKNLLLVDALDAVIKSVFARFLSRDVLSWPTVMTIKLLMHRLPKTETSKPSFEKLSW